MQKLSNYTALRLMSTLGITEASLITGCFIAEAVTVDSGHGIVIKGFKGCYIDDVDIYVHSNDGKVRLKDHQVSAFKVAFLGLITTQQSQCLDFKIQYTPTETRDQN